MSRTQLNRRQLLQGSGALVVGFSIGGLFGRGASAQDATPVVEPGTVATPSDQTEQAVQTRNATGDTVDSWLAIDKNGAVTLYVGKVELGTGIQTALGQIAAEELDVPFDRVTVIQGDTALTPDQGYTAGSKSLQTAGPVVQKAAAQARLILLGRASSQLGVPTDDLQVVEGVIQSISDTSVSVPYGDLVDQPFTDPVTADIPTKSPDQYTIVGTPVHRVDILGKITGGQAYVQDIQLDGMLHGRIVRPHVRTMDGVGATIVSVDDTDAKQIPGVQILRSGNFIGVVAEREENAIKASQALKVTWSTPDALPNEADYYEQIKELSVDDVEVTRNGDVEDALAIAAQSFEEWYQFPTQAHAPIGPSCAVADVRADGATVYSHTQGVYFLRDAIAPLIGLEKEQVHLIYREGSGCYGHDGADDVAADAALLSKLAGAPVRVQWMRQDEFAYEPKGPQMVSHLRGGIDSDGNIIAWDYEVWTPTHSTRPGGKPGNLLAGQLMDPPAEPVENGTVGGDRNAPHNYSLPNNNISVHWTGGAPLRPSALRSLGALANSTANESFFDELAVAANADPVEFRLRHLVDPRAIDVINKAAETANWQARPSGPAASGATPTANGLMTGRGIAFIRYETEYSYAAVVAEVEVDPSQGNVRVTNVTVAHDCGLIVNPDGLTNQIQGNVIQGVSRMLKEEVTYDTQAVTSLDWSTYHILTFPEVPNVNVALIDRPNEVPWGAGEITICAMGGAINNAIFDATGVRLRTAPYTPDRVLAALQSA